jgi:hypothetical protein
MDIAKARFPRVSMLIFGAAALFGAQKNAPLPKLTAHIYNYAAIPAAELLGAEREAQDVFHEAGIDVEWIECGVLPGDTGKVAACHKNSPLSVDVKLLPEWMAVRMPYPSSNAAVAIPSTIFVFWQRVRQATEGTGVSEPLMLGVTLAHELGHELLGNSSHSPCGIMKPKLQRDDFSLAKRGRLMFCPEQATRLHATVERAILP